MRGFKVTTVLLLAAGSSCITLAAAVAVPQQPSDEAPAAVPDQSSLQADSHSNDSNAGFQSKSSEEPSATCIYHDKLCASTGDTLHMGFNYFEVTTKDWPDDPRGCVLGVLDNVRGKTSGAEGEGWKCDSYPASHQHQMWFQVSTVYRDAGTKVADAIKLASPGGKVNVNCEFHEIQTAADHQSYPIDGADVCPT